MNLNCKFIVFLLFLCLFTISCSNKHEVTYQAPVFEKQQEVSFEIINDSFMFKTATYGLIVSDSLLILCDPFINPVIHLFDKESGLFLKSVGVTGHGPTELVTPVTFSFDHNNGIIYVFDAGKRAIVSYDIKSVMDDKKISAKEKRVQNSTINRVHYLKDSLFIAYINSKGLTVSAFNENSGENGFNSEAPPGITSKKWDYFLSSYTTSAVSPDGNKYVIATSYGGIMDIFSIENDEVKRYDRKNFYKFVYDEKEWLFVPDEKTIFGFYILSVTNNFIYATAFGIANPTETPKNIWKFDWKGNPVENYICDYNIENFVIDEPSGTIYAAVYNKDGELALAKGKIKP
jgi:hypothetical protein